MSATCLATSWRKRCAASLRSSSVRRGAQRRDGLEREFGVDHQRALVGQEHDAVRPRVVGQRVLEFVKALGQAILHDRLHAGLAERAARLLVGEHVAQRGHVRREIGQVLLRIVDHGEPLVQGLQAVDGLLGVGLERGAEPAATPSRAARTGRGRARPAGRRAPRPWPAAARRSPIAGRRAPRPSPGDAPRCRPAAGPARRRPGRGACGRRTTSQTRAATPAASTTTSTVRTGTRVSLIPVFYPIRRPGANEV